MKTDEQVSGHTLVLVSIMAGTFMAPLDSSIVNIALPAVSADLGARLTAVGWVASIYLLTNAALILTMGRVGDIWGLRRLYVSGFLVFGVGSLASALAPTLAWLVAARALQAVGAAAMFAAGPAIVAETFPSERRGRALGLVGLSVSVGLMAGPILGGFLVGRFGWPSIFLINVPLSVAGALFAWRVIPDDVPRDEPIDVPGALLSGGALLSLLYGLSEGDRLGWDSPVILAAFAGAAALGVAFVTLERRIEHPMLDLRLFDRWAFSAGALSAVLAYLAMFSVSFLMPFYLLRAKDVGEQTAGLIMSAAPVALALLAPLAGRLSDRWGAQGLSTGGLVGVAAALFGLSRLEPGTGIWMVVALLLLQGAGSAFFQSPNTSAILGATPANRRGVGSAVVGEARNVGMVLGIAVSGALVASQLADPDLLTSAVTLDAEQARRVVGGISVAFRAAAGFALVGAVVSWSRGTIRADRRR